MSYPQTAQAIRISQPGGPEVLELVEVPVRAPGTGEVVVAIRAAGVNPVDAKIRSGKRLTAPLTEPIGIGSDAAGEVVAVGTEVTDLAVGDRVIGRALPGAYAEFVTAAAALFTPLPGSLSFEQGAALGVPASTAYQLLKSLGLQSGHTLLVHAGSGAVGQAAIQLARLEGATVIATASEPNHARLRELGAIPVAYGDGLLERVRASAGRIDRVLEAAGTQEALDVSLAVVDDPQHVGEIVVPGWAAEYGVQVFSGGLPGSMGPAVQALRAESIPYVAQLAAEGRFDIEVSRSFALADAAEAHREIERGHTRGKIVLLP